MVFIKINSIYFAIMDFNTLPDPHDLIYFQEIARTQNLSRAAERLGVGQPTLSLSLKRLEETLAIQLFVRRSRGLELTIAGQRLLRECNGLMDSWERIVSETRKSKTELIGRFRFGCHPSVGIYTLGPNLKSLMSQYPGIEIELQHGLSREICEGVISGKIDFAIVINPIEHPDLVIHRLAGDEVGFWRTKRGVEDVLIYNPALSQSQNLIKKIRQPFARTMTSDSLELMATLADAGVGTAILPSRVVKAIAPKLIRVFEKHRFLDEVAFVYRVDLPKTAGSQCIVDQFKSLKI
ncbi:MAG: LysR family transcriptional regulator [Bdellovibrionales bacterium]|nr:LysR family transcriptional regulator [Bdellovibrionales bacterium]